MKYRRFGLFCLVHAVVVAVVLDKFAEARPADSQLRRFALIVSSNDGGKDRVPLRFAHSDADAMASVLRGLGGLHQDDVTLLRNATPASLRAAFDRLQLAIRNAARAQARLEFVLYYSGHSDEQGLLLGDDRVSYRDLREWIDGTNADVRIAILDSCASGSLIRLRGGKLRPPFLTDVSSSARGHAFLTASSAHESAQESDRIGAAFFTHSLVSGLRGAADTSRDGRVTLGEAYQFAFHETLGRTERTNAGPQHPAYDIRLTGTGDLVLTDLRAGGSNLVLDESLRGRIYVRDGSGRLVVELRKEPTYPVELGLGPGDYQVTVDADGKAYEASVTLEDGKNSHLGKPQLIAASAQPSTARGGGESKAAAGEKLAPTTVGSLVMEDFPALGGYASLPFRYARLDDRDAFFGGVELGLLFNRRYIVGVLAMGGTLGDAAKPGGKVTMGFGALVLRYRMLFGGSPFDLTAGMAAGPGGATFEREGMVRQDGTLFVFEPQLDAHVNLTRWLRFGAGFGYRLVAGLDLSPAGGLRSITAGAQLQAGWF